jgi:hypothetical protein
MQTDLIRRLWDYGHFHNPAHPTGVVEADLPKLKLTDASVRTALASFQEFMAADFDRLALEEHGRIGIADGDMGPATEKLFEVERCGCPDYEMATDGHVEQAGRGSWPNNCRPDFPGLHTFSVQMNKAGMPSYLRDTIEPAWDLCRRAYANMGILFLREDSNNRANTLVTWQRGAGWIGLAIVPRSPQCGERIWARFDNRYQPRDLLNQWARLLAHEFGHNMGMSHSRGGIMNPSIVSGPFTPTAWRGDPSEPILRRFFGGQPIPIDGPKPDEPKPDEPKPPITDQDFVFTGDFELKQGDRSFGRFILVPRPQV